MKPLIGLIPLFDDNLDSYWMLPGYMKALEEADALPIMLPLTTDEKELEQCVLLCDGFLFTGGHDVSPKVYGEEEIRPGICGCNPERDAMESYILDRCYELDKPAFGICRGIQFINAHFGGTLYQDLSLQYESSVEHHMEPPYDRHAHMVNILDNTLLKSILCTDRISVNSYHHQAIKDVSPNAEVMALSEDGLVEAIRIKNKKYIVALQWHPEFSYKLDDNSKKLVRSFVEACNK